MGYNNLTSFPTRMIIPVNPAAAARSRVCARHQYALLRGERWSLHSHCACAGNVREFWAVFTTKEFAKLETYSNLIRSHSVLGVKIHTELLQHAEEFLETLHPSCNTLNARRFVHSRASGTHAHTGEFVLCGELATKDSEWMNNSHSQSIRILIERSLDGVVR